MYARIYIYVCILTYIYVSINIVCMHVRMYVCMHARVHTYIHPYMHAYRLRLVSASHCNLPQDQIVLKLSHWTLQLCITGRKQLKSEHFMFPWGTWNIHFLPRSHMGMCVLHTNTQTHKHTHTNTNTNTNTNTHTSGTCAGRHLPRRAHTFGTYLTHKP